MAVIGISRIADTLVLWNNREFNWTFQNLDANSNPTDFPAGSLFFELQTADLTVWPFTISGDTATLSVPAQVVAQVPNNTKFQLVFAPSGDVSGGDPISYGVVTKVG